MRAFRYTAPHRTELTTVPQPDPKPGEVLIEVGAAGACHPDLHIIDSPAGSFPAPLTLGHENAGWIEAVGEGVTGWERREAVAIYGIIGCGRCPACLRGGENACRAIPPGGIGISRDGGMAEYVTVLASRLVAIGDLDVAQAAPLTDAGLTPYHSIQLCRDALVPGATCVVLGVRRRQLGWRCPRRDFLVGECKWLHEPKSSARSFCSLTWLQQQQRKPSPHKNRSDIRSELP